VAGKNELFARARVFLHLNTIPERFGLVLVEANAAGVPVIAMDLGSCREVIKDGETGFLVDNVAEAVQVLGRISEIDRRAWRGTLHSEGSPVADIGSHRASTESPVSLRNTVQNGSLRKLVRVCG
jgi:glycosyltransferase involved in cell wall biosynthesis